MNTAKTKVSTQTVKPFLLFISHSTTAFFLFDATIKQNKNKTKQNTIKKS